MKFSNKAKKIDDIFRRIIKQDPESYYNDYLQIKETVDNSSAIYEGEPVDFLYQPVFYSDSDIDNIKRIINRLKKILLKVIEKYRNNSQFRSYFAFPSLLEELILQDPRYDREFPMARFDLFYNGENSRFCELNADGTSGMNEIRVLQKCFQNSKIMYRLSENFGFSTYELFYSWIDKVEENYINWGGNPDEPPGLAIIDFAGEGIESEFEEFKKRFKKQGYQTVICDPRELEYKNKKLYYQNNRIDIIYRRATTFRLMEESDEIKDLLNAYRDGNVCLVGGFVSQLIHNKKIFALLRDEKKMNFLKQEEKDYIKQYIPWTEIFNIDDINQYHKVLENRENYILKPSDWFACHGVYAGRDYSKVEWKKILESTTDREYIVQEFHSPPQKKLLNFNSRGDPEFESFNILTGIYLYNHNFAGIYNRVGRENIIGAREESFTLPVFVVN